MLLRALPSHHKREKQKKTQRKTQRERVVLGVRAAQPVPFLVKVRLPQIGPRKALETLFGIVWELGFIEGHS